LATDNKPSQRQKLSSTFKPKLCESAVWHIDVSYLNIAGTFYYLCSVLDGFSRSIVHWDCASG
jgi:hypothetical protein